MRDKKGSFVTIAKIKTFLGLGRANSYEHDLQRSQLVLFGLEKTPNNSVFEEFFHFCFVVRDFLLEKIGLLLKFPFKLLRFSFQTLIITKRFAVRKLLWGGGKLFIPATRFGVLVFAIGVFVFGSTGWVKSKGTLAPFSGEGEILASTTAGPVSFTNTPGGEAQKYLVKEGDTLSSIGEQFKVSIASIRYANNLSDVHYIKPGQELTIPPVSGVLHTVEKGDTVKSLAQKYDVSPQSIVDFNYLFQPYTLREGDVVVVPGGEVPAPKPKEPQYAARPEEVPSRPVASLGTGQFSWPTNRRGVSQYFSRWHPAVDVPKFSPIYAIDSGTVVEARKGGWNFGYGRLVRIDHGNGYQSLYAHMSSVHVQLNQRISRGQNIGNMGNTGRSFGTHLHLEITYQGRHINPLSVL